VSIDAVLFNGTLLTQDPTHPSAEALAISGGRIHAVGARKDIEPLAGPSTERIDLEGGTLLPGFNDSHVHVWKMGQLLSGILDLRSIRSLDELRALVLRRDRELPRGTWLLGRGYNELLLAEGRQPTRQDLDQAAPHRPVALTRTCGHMVAANSRALALAGIDRNRPDPPGGSIVRDASGEPTGVLQETAMGVLRAVMPEPTPSEYEDMVRAGIDAQLTRGITSASEAGANPNLISAYRTLDGEGGLKHRMNVMAMRLSEQDGKPLSLPERWVSPFLRVDSVKLFADGGLSGATAALKSSYRHETGRGLLRLSEEEVFTHSLDAQRAGFRVCTHAIGDAAIDVVLGAYERLQELGGRGHRVEHFGLPDRRQIERAFRAGAMAAPQTVFLHALGGNFRRYLSDEYLERCYPIRSMLGGGLVVALGSDAPVVPDDRPLLGVQAAVRRRTLDGDAIAPREAIRVEEALFGYSMGGALASGDAGNRGSLTAGKWADLVLLDENPCRVGAEDIAAVQVLATYVSGRRVYPA
jgi:predicted amidohydrolase YtcJ